VSRAALAACRQLGGRHAERSGRAGARLARRVPSPRGGLGRAARL